MAFFRRITAANQAKAQPHKPLCQHNRRSREWRGGNFGCLAATQSSHAVIPGMTCTQTFGDTLRTEIKKNPT